MARAHAYRMYWKDPSLTWDREAWNVPYLTFKRTEIWTPVCTVVKTVVKTIVKTDFDFDFQTHRDLDTGLCK